MKRYVGAGLLYERLGGAQGLAGKRIRLRPWRVRNAGWAHKYRVGYRRRRHTSHTRCARCYYILINVSCTLVYRPSAAHAALAVLPRRLGLSAPVLRSCRSYPVATLNPDGMPPPPPSPLLITSNARGENNKEKVKLTK